MESLNVFKALGDETRFNIVQILLRHNCCVRSLARRLGLSEATVSQHLKILREAGVICGNKKGYFVYYSVCHDLLKELATDLQAWSELPPAVCSPEKGGCNSTERVHCHLAKHNAACEERRGLRCRRGKS